MRRDALDGLLSRGGLGGPTRDRILEGALRDAQIAGPPWYRRRAVLWGSPLLACAAAVALFALAKTPGDGMRAKGGAEGPIVSGECAGRAPGRCAATDLILFRVEALARDGRLAAYAEPAAGGERIWFFPSGDGDAPAVHARPEPEVLPEAVAARALAPGLYRIHFVITTRTLPKAEILAATGPDVIAVRTVTLEIMP